MSPLRPTRARVLSGVSVVLLLAGFAALVAVLSPFHNTPVQDDWDYARTVQILLQTGSFQRSELAQASEVSSALWGAAFASVLGFSFDTLRLSTLVLSALALLLFFALLGELGFSGAGRNVAVAALLVCPLFLFLSFSFMTDVPALACLLAAFYCYVRALRRGDMRWALAGSVCAALAFLTRQLGLVSALAAAGYFIVRPPTARAMSLSARRAQAAALRPAEGSPVPATRLDSIVRRRRAARAKVRLEEDGPSFFARFAGLMPRRRALHAARPAVDDLTRSSQRRGFTPPLRPVTAEAPSFEQRMRWAMASVSLPLLVALLYSGWLALSGGVTWANSRLALDGALAFIADPQTPAVLLRRVVEDCMTLAVYLLPLWLLLVPALHGGRAAPAAQLLPAPGRWSRVARLVRAVPWLWLAALPVGAVFGITTYRLAQRGEYLPYLTDVVTRQGLSPYLATFAYAGGAFRPDILPLPFWAALTLLGCAGGCALALLALRRLWTPGPRAVASGTGFVYWSAFCLAVPTLLFPEFYERFLLPFLPLALILLLDAGRRARSAPWLGAAGVLLMACCSLALLRDYWGWMDVRWPLAQAIVASGVPPQKLDGGYEWDGWNLYEQSIDLIRRQELPMQITPWAYTLDPQYVLAFTPLLGYHVTREVPFDSPFGAAAGRFYVLQRD